MKTFHQILSEVAQPKSEDELNFKDKHVVDAIDHPESEEHQHVADDKYKRSAKRIADYDEGEDEDVYEELDPVGREDDDIDNDGDVDNSDRYLKNRRKAITKAIKEATKAPATNHDTYEDYVKANKSKGAQVMPKSLWMKLKNESVDDFSEEKQPRWKVQIGKKHYTVVARNTAEANRKAMVLAKKDDNMGVGGTIERIREETEQLDELSPNTLHRYIKKASADMKKHAHMAGYDSKSRAYNNAAKNSKRANKRLDGIMSASGRLADKANSDMYESFNIEEDNAHFITKAAASKKAGKKSFEIGGKEYPVKVKDKNVHKIVKEDLNENFKAGALKLNDGSSVIVKKQDADLLNQMFKDLNAANRKKMEKVLMTDKAGFEEILGFAREAL